MNLVTYKNFAKGIANKIAKGTGDKEWKDEGSSAKKGREIKSG